MSRWRDLLLAFACGGIVYGFLTAITWPEGPALAESLFVAIVAVVIAIDVEEWTRRQRG